MSFDDYIVLGGGFVAIVLVAWFFWGPRGEGIRATTMSSGRQEALILVKGGYTPDIIVVEQGRPVRLNFRREETAACSEMVLLPDFDRSAALPEGDTIPIDFVPEVPGEYEFTCQMGMLRGKLIVE